MGTFVSHALIFWTGFAINSPLLSTEGWDLPTLGYPALPRSRSSVTEVWESYNPKHPISFPTSIITTLPMDHNGAPASGAAQETAEGEASMRLLPHQEDKMRWR